MDSEQPKEPMVAIHEGMMKRIYLSLLNAFERIQGGTIDISECLDYIEDNFKYHDQTTYKMYSVRKTEGHIKEELKKSWDEQTYEPIND